MAEALNFVLVGGPPSSGSTLLSVMLDSHPEVVCGPETNLFAHPGLWRQGADVTRFLTLPVEYEPIEEGVTWARPAEAALEYFAVSLADLVAGQEANPGIAGLARQLFAAPLAAAGKRVACEKSPSNIYAIAAALRAQPGMKAIVMVRDAPDILRSLERRKVKPNVAVYRWLTDTNLALDVHRTFGPERVHLVRFEDLIADPLAVAEGLCAFLAVDSAGAEAMVTRSGSKRIGSDDSIAGSKGAAAVWTRKPDAPIRAVPAKDARDLTEEEVGYLNSARLDGAIMRHLGLTGKPRSPRQLSRELGYGTPWWRFQPVLNRKRWPGSTNRLFVFYGKLKSKRRSTFLEYF